MNYYGPYFLCSPPNIIHQGTKIDLCKILGFYVGDYEEFHILGYKNPVRISKETHYVFATEPSRLILCKICGFHGGDYEDCRLLG
jgi:hypothetical protein